MEMSIRTTKPTYERLVDERIASLELLSSIALNTLAGMLHSHNELFTLTQSERADLDAVLAILDSRGEL